VLRKYTGSSNTGLLCLYFHSLHLHINIRVHNFAIPLSLYRSVSFFLSNSCVDVCVCGCGCVSVFVVCVCCVAHEYTDSSNTHLTCLHLHTLHLRTTIREQNFASPTDRSFLLPLRVLSLSLSLSLPLSLLFSISLSYSFFLSNSCASECVCMSRANTRIISVHT